jgi:hypothetical protein
MSQVIEPPLMHPVAGALVVLDEAFDGAIGADLWQLTDAELLEAARELHRQQCRSEALQLALVREIDQRGAAVALGAPSTKAWLRSGLRMHPGAAKRLAATATALHSDPAGPLTSYEEDAEADDVPPRVRGLAASREALAAGAISAEHVSVIAEALAALPPEVGRSTIAEGEAVLAHYAREHDPAELGSSASGCCTASTPTAEIASPRTS